MESNEIAAYNDPAYVTYLCARSAVTDILTRLDMYVYDATFHREPKRDVVYVYITESLALVLRIASTSDRFIRELYASLPIDPTVDTEALVATLHEHTLLPLPLDLMIGNEDEGEPIDPVTNERRHNHLVAMGELIASLLHNIPRSDGDVTFGEEYGGIRGLSGRQVIDGSYDE